MPKHKDEPMMIKISKMSPKNKNLAYHRLRSKSKFNYNYKEAGKENPKYLTYREIASSKKLAYCEECLDFMSTYNIRHHKCRQSERKTQKSSLSCLKKVSTIEIY